MAGRAPSSSTTSSPLPTSPAGPRGRPLPTPPTTSSSAATRRTPTHPRLTVLDPVMEGEVPTQPELAVGVSWVRPSSAPSTPSPGKRSNFVKESFQESEANLQKKRVRDEALIVAELRTNLSVITSRTKRNTHGHIANDAFYQIRDEINFLAELSTHMSTRYSRPLNSIVVTLQHSVHMVFSGSAEPCYVFTIQALEHHVQETTNKRNVALIQRHMEQALRVPAHRGVVRFVPVSEECFGWSGRTVAGEIWDLEHGKAPEAEEKAKSESIRKRFSLRRAASMVSRGGGGSDSPAVVGEFSAPSTPIRRSSSSISRVLDERRGKKLKKKTSLMRLLFPGTSKSDDGPMELLR
ncbi:hypothetical protein S40293_09423 [Stachybotrys chartarum IBT 40293]|nr:hypothetical protein S40293_09423 [Stachybotrys chartarum IBT 40293]